MPVSGVLSSDTAHKPPSVDFASKMTAERFGYCFKALAAAKPAGPAPINENFSMQVSLYIEHNRYL
jgi:hypothetical protein